MHNVFLSLITVGNTFPLVIIVGNTFPFIITVGNTFPLIITVGNTFPPLVVTVGNTFPLLITVGNTFPLVITVGNTFPLVITVENTVPLLTTVGKNNGSSFFLKKCGTSEISSMGHRRKGNCGGLFIYLIANNLKFNRTNFDYRFPSLILIINLSKHNEVKLFILLHYCT